MDRILYKEADGDITCRSRDFDKVFPTLYAYEELEMTPEEIETTLLRFSSFLMEMTGGRMSKTNYTVQAMVDEANDYRDRRIEELEAELEGLKNSYQQLQEINDRTYQSNLDMGKDLEKVKQERDAAISAICKIAERGTTWMCPYCKNAKSIYSGMCDCALGIGVCQPPFTKFEWRGEKLEDSYYG